MKRLLYLFFACAFSCGYRDPNRDDFIGTWKSSAGAHLALSGNGKFVSHSMPSKLLLRTEVEEVTLSGDGKWELVSDQGRWIVQIIFDSTNTTQFKKGFVSELEISGSGILESDSPFYLYLWEGEEGASNRYSFKRTGSPPTIDD